MLFIAKDVTFLFYFLFRPIPVYGNRVQIGVNAQIPAEDNSLSPVKSREDQVRLAKQINLISHMSRLRALGDYRFNQLAQLGNSAAAQVFGGINTLSAKNLAVLNEIERNHATTQPKVQTSVQEKIYEYSGDKARRQSLLTNPGGHSDAQTSSVDRSTVPVIIACANPYPSQYGYGRKVFPCPQCRYTTDRRNNLKRHMLTMHQTCAKTLECCGIVFATKASLREHAMIFHYHGYTCFYCGRRFCRKALLKRHLSVHNGQKDFVCPVCDYATSHKSNLERHRKVHCRPDDKKGDENESEATTSQNWRTRDEDADGNNNTHVNQFSDEDSEEEINVESD